MGVKDESGASESSALPTAPQGHSCTDRDADCDAYGNVAESRSEGYPNRNAYAYEMRLGALGIFLLFFHIPSLNGVFPRGS